MPLLNSNYLSHFQNLHNNTNGKSILTQGFSCVQTEEVANVNNILQGSTGSHIKNIGATEWKTVLNSPVCIFNSAAAAFNLIESPIDLLISSMKNYPILSSNHLDPSFVLYYDEEININTIIMDTATISVDATKGVTCDIGFVSDHDVMTTYFSLPDSTFDYGILKNNDIIGRTAKNFDSKISLGLRPFSEINSWIIEGTINIKPTVQRVFFISSNLKENISSIKQSPNLFVNEYIISGKIKIPYGNYPNIDLSISLQDFNYFNVNTKGLFLQFGNYKFEFPDVNIIYNKIEKDMNSPINTASIDFEAYVPRFAAYERSVG